MGWGPDTVAGRPRWFLQAEDPCHCEVIEMAGPRNLAPCQPIKVTYYDTLLLSSDPVEIRRWLSSNGMFDRAELKLAKLRGEGEE